MPVSDHSHCPHCHAFTPDPPSVMLRAAAVGGAWAVSMVTVFVAISTGPFILGILPFSLPAGIGIIAAAHRYAFDDRICDACGKAYVIDGAWLEPVTIDGRVEYEHEPAWAA